MTCSAVDPEKLARARRQVFLALFIAIAVSLHILESLLPSPVPWLRLGLANTLALAALYLYDGRAAWTVSLARVGIGALLLGRLFSPGVLARFDRRNRRHICYDNRAPQLRTVFKCHRGFGDRRRRACPGATSGGAATDHTT